MVGGAIVEKCVGCANQTALNCNIWGSPAAKWRIGGCGTATHVERKAEPTQKVRVGQQKQRKSK